jgi:hypothetical protein
MMIAQLATGDLCANNKAQAPYAPNSDRERRRSLELNDLAAPPRRDQTHKRIGLVHAPAAPSSTPANRHLNPTESRFIDRLNESFASFATQSGVKRTSQFQSVMSAFDPSQALTKWLLLSFFL